MNILNRLSYIISITSILIIFIAANKADKSKYSIYQIMVWELKANEGYREWWYPDGYVRGKQSYSIGFGWNDQGGRRRHEIKQYTQDLKVTISEATEITIKEMDKYGKLHSDPYKNLALKLYAYNCGIGNAKPYNLGHCCKGKYLCGNRNKDIRTSHSRRRKFELALWNRDIDYIDRITEQNKSIISTRKHYEK